METLGIWLRTAREEKGVTPAQVEVATRIRPRFLELLEAGNFSALPGGDMQARGFLRVYSRYLGLSPDEAIARYEAEFHGITRPGSNGGTPHEAPAPSAPRSLAAENPRPSPAPALDLRAPARRRFGPIEKIVVAGLSVVAVLIAVVLISQTVSLRTGEWSLAGPIAERLEGVAAESTVEPTTPIVSQPTPEPPQPTSELPVISSTSADGVTVTLEATEHTWLRVSVDNQVVFQGILAPAQVQVWPGQQIVVVETGNAAGLDVTVNDQLLGVLGARGEVSRRAWGLSGEVSVPPSSEP